MKHKQYTFTAERMQYVRPCAWAEEFSPERVLCGSLYGNADAEDYAFDDIWILNL